MQKNLPKYTPGLGPPLPVWAEASHREISYALCDDRRTLLWFANQRAVEYHPTLARADAPEHPTHLVLDLDPPEGDGFGAVVRGRAAGPPGARRRRAGRRGEDQRRQGRARLRPGRRRATAEEAAAATRALAARAERLDPALATTAYIKEDRGGKVFVDATRAGGATVVAAYSPRLRPGVPVSFPVDWADLDERRPRRTSPSGPCPPLLGETDPWAAADARAAAAARRPGRRGADHPGGPGAGHARGQAPGPSPPRNHLTVRP